MDAIKNLKQEKDVTFNYKAITCSECNRKLKICRIQRKKNDNCREFAIFTFYCNRCKLTYFIFKFMNLRSSSGGSPLENKGKGWPKRNHELEPNVNKKNDLKYKLIKNG
jgi:hypothetical protein